jgi:hypothetical protein
MSLEKIKGSYDAVFSLGNLCLGAMQLEKFNLRPFSGVLDWVGSHSLPDVNRLLQNRFSGFMELPNLKVVGHASELDLFVLDEVYKIGFNHDFKTDKNTVSHLAAYPEVKEKYDRRVQRFLEKMATSKRILFIRTEGTFQDVQELESILSGMVKNDFRLLVVNHTNVNGMIDINWPLQKVSAVELPNGEIWNANDQYWAAILNGVHLSV